MTDLLKFTAGHETSELHLMLTMGFFTGARFGTITSIRIENLEQARPDPHMKEFLLIRVGPGTGVETKFDVAGDLLVPCLLFDELKRYAYSAERLTAHDIFSNAHAAHNRKNGIVAHWTAF